MIHTKNGNNWLGIFQEVETVKLITHKGRRKDGGRRPIAVQLLT